MGVPVRVDSRTQKWPRQMVSAGADGSAVTSHDRVGRANMPYPTLRDQPFPASPHRSRERPGLAVPPRSRVVPCQAIRAGAEVTGRKDDGRLRASLIQRDKSSLGSAGLAVPLDFPTNLKQNL